MQVQPLERNVCTVVIETTDGYVPVVGLNETARGYFLNYYLGRPHSFFGNLPHISRHKNLIAARHSENDFYSASEGVVSIDERKTPEELPSCSVTSDLYSNPITERKDKVKQPLVVPLDQVPRGILVRVMIWPRHLQPTNQQMEQEFNRPPHFEPLIKTFLPTGFSNRLIVGAFSIDRLQRDALFFVDEPVVGSADGPTFSHPITLRGPRKGK